MSQPVLFQAAVVIHISQSRQKSYKNLSTNSKKVDWKEKKIWKAGSYTLKNVAADMISNLEACLECINTSHRHFGNSTKYSRYALFSKKTWESKTKTINMANLIETCMNSFNCSTSRWSRS